MTDALNNVIDKITKNNKKEKRDSWVRLDRSSKIYKIKHYIEEYAKTNHLTTNEKEDLNKYLIQCLERKRLQNSREVKYNKEEGIIEQLPYLIFNTTQRKFTLKKNENRISTLSSLGHGKTKKNKIKNNNQESIED